MEFFSRTVLSNAIAGEVYIPREVMCRENISDNTKLIFGMMFSECLNKMDSMSDDNISQAASILKNCGANVPLTTIERECLCGTETAKNIQKELSFLTATLDIASCIHECELNYINVQQPICRMCDNGKILYKMFDLVNTVVDRQLHHTDFKKQFSEDELETLNAYDKSHSSELLSDVIDILKR